MTKKILIVDDDLDITKFLDVLFKHNYSGKGDKGDKGDKGTGLGLCIAQRSVKQHNGVFKINSMPGSVYGIHHKHSRPI